MNFLFLADLQEDGLVWSELIQDPLGIAILIVSALILLVGIASGIIEIVLAIKYIKFNRRQNNAGITGKDAARQLLDANGLENIKVKVTGSIMFGNSYSHYFKKLRLRRLTWKKKSISSLAMAAQKTGLAVLDKEEDPDMVKRVKLTPVIYFGPLAFIPIIFVGIVVDLLMFGFGGFVTVLSAFLGFAFMVVSFILSLSTLKTEKKAQEKAYVMLKENNMATNEELEMMQELFHLYNIEYINDVILSFLEIIYRILVMLYKLKGNSSNSNSKK